MLFHRTAHTPFYAFPFPDARNQVFQFMLNALSGSAHRPLLILLSRRSRDFIPPLEPSFQTFTISFSKFRIPDGTEFSRFKQIVFNHLKFHPRSAIGVLSSKGRDLCGYFIVRWLLEERTFSMAEAVGFFNAAIPNGLAKQKYLSSIAEIYSDGPPPQFGAVYPRFGYGAPAAPPPVYTAPIAAPANRRISIVASESALRVPSPKAEWEEDDHPLLDGVGSVVAPKTAEQIRQELRVLLEVDHGGSFITPLLTFTENTINVIKSDQTRLYVALPVPAGRRCLLYARGSDRYLVGDRIFLRQVEIYLPESEDRSHILTSAILEGILVAQESRCRFFVYDILRIEGEDLRLRAYERRLSALHTRVLRFRRDQQTRGLFADFFKTDEIEMDGLPFLRLKYVDSIVDNPQKYIPGCRARGLFFCHKGTPTERWMMWWRGPCKIGLPLTVRLTAGVVEGVATDGADVIPVATFGQATDAWKAVEGRCVDVWQSEDGKWELMGISEAETPVSASAFASAAGGAGRRMYSEEDLKKDILAITRLPQYVEEDLSKMHANRA